MSGEALKADDLVKRINAELKVVAYLIDCFVEPALEFAELIYMPVRLVLLVS